MVNALADAKEMRTLITLLKRLDGTFVQLGEVMDGRSLIALHNPGIRDFAHAYLAQSPKGLELSLDRSTSRREASQVPLPYWCGEI